MRFPTQRQASPATHSLSEGCRFFLGDQLYESSAGPHFEVELVAGPFSILETGKPGCAARSPKDYSAMPGSEEITSREGSADTPPRIGQDEGGFRGGC